MQVITSSSKNHHLGEYRAGMVTGRIEPQKRVLVESLKSDRGLEQKMVPEVAF